MRRSSCAELRGSFDKVASFDKLRMILRQAQDEDLKWRSANPAQRAVFGDSDRYVRGDQRLVVGDCGTDAGGVWSGGI